MKYKNKTLNYKFGSLNFKQLLLQYKTPILYTGGSTAKALATIIVGFVVAKFISPNDLGVWSTINLAVTYSFFLQAGLINGLNIELPFTLGKGDDDQAKILAGTAQTFTFLSSCLILILGLGYFFFIPEDNSKIRYGVLAITFFISLNYYQNYLISTFRSKDSFTKLSLFQVVDAFVNLSTLVLVVYYSYYGMIIKSIVGLFIYVLLLHFSRPVKVGFIWNKLAFIKLFKVGIPIFGLVYLDSISSTIDKLWLLKFSNMTNVGLYSFAMYSLTLFTLFSASIASYIYPRMTYSYGKNNNTLVLWNYAKKISVILFLIQLPLAILGCYVIPILVTTFFPNYVLSILAMQILLFAGVFKGSVVGVNALWSMKSWKYMLQYQLLYSFLLIGLTFIGIKFFANVIEGVAYGVLLANAINLVSGMYFTYVATHKE